MKVAIFGGGPCGLTATWELAKHNVDVTVIEKDDRVGGLCKTIRKDGHQFDLGGHRFISRELELIEKIRDLMDGELLTRSRKSVIRFRNRTYDYPINLFNVIQQSTYRMTGKFAMGYLAYSTGLIKSRAPDNSFEKWVDIKFGKPLNDFFFKPYTEKLWGIPASLLSDEWANQRISLLNAGDALFKAMGLSHNHARTHALKYLYPKGGIGAIFETMANKIGRSGGKIMTGSQPISIKTKGNHICSALVKDSNGAKINIEADYYLSTIPLDALSNLLGRNMLKSLPYRSLRFLNIMLNRKSFSTNTWMYIPELDFIMTRIQEPKHRSPFNAPDGKTSLILEIPCKKGDVVWNMEDKELLSRAVKDLQALGFNIKDEIYGYFSTRAEHAYPCYNIRYMEAIEEMRNIAGSFTNLTTLGRQGLFRYIFMDTSMMMGLKWARKILGYGKELKIDKMDSDPVLLEAQSIAK